MLKTAVLVALWVFAARAAQAQGSRNEILREFAGVPWGAPVERVRGALGEPDSAVARGDSTTLVYLHREVFGLPARMEVRTTTALGLYFGTYRILEPRCETIYRRLRGEIARAYPRLKRTEPVLLSDIRPNDAVAPCEATSFVLSESYTEPYGRGRLALAESKSPQFGLVVHLIYFSGLESPVRP